MSPHIRTLKDGYWDRTTVVRAVDGSLRVRKESRATVSPGPWAHAALRNEIRFLNAFRENQEIPLPTLLECWDGETIGYEIPFFEDRVDVARSLLAGELEQDAADDMQAELCLAIFDGLHRSQLLQDDHFALHVQKVIRESIITLGGEERFHALAAGPQVRINDQKIPTLAASLGLLEEQSLFEKLGATPDVLLHGDLILENILWAPLLLIDPVSVAGLTSGHPLFDLVKYESYARGELYAIREELVTAEPVEAGFVFQIDWEHPDLAPFRRLDLCAVFREGYLNVYHDLDHSLYSLIDAYFSLVMARNTTGTHQWARVLKGCQCLAAAAGEWDPNL
jgi:hypothetical protein